MSKHASIIRAAIERLDSLMAIGVSRHEAKRAIRQTNTSAQWSVATGRIHSHQSRQTYQQHVLAFVGWARAQHGLTRLEELDAVADNLASVWLQERLEQGKSPYTLSTERSALRLFFSDRDLATCVELPKRNRDKITRSRGGARRSGSGQFQPANWTNLLDFERAVGLRRTELAGVHVGDVHGGPGGLELHAIGKGGRHRDVPVLAGHEEAVLRMVEGRDPEERIFGRRLPSHADFHAERRAYSQALYIQLSGRDLPPKEGRLPRGSYDREAVLVVSRALGHNRVDVVLRHYLR